MRMPRLPSLTLADVVSLSRLVLAAAFVVARGAVVRLALIVAAGITDLLDGWIARRRNETSGFGAVLDPAADRAFVLIVVGTLLVEGALTGAQTLILMARDVVTTIGVVAVRAIAALRSVRVEARFSGKVVTVLQFATLVGVMVDPRTIPWLLGLVAAASAISVMDYAAAIWRMRVAALLVALVVATPVAIEAQGFPGGRQASLSSRIRTEARADAFAARIDALHAGVGLATDLGTYFRLAGIIGVGAADVGSEIVASGRAEILGRFVLDPLRQARWGVYGATGVVARYEESPGTRGYLTLLLGVELPSDRPRVTALELGIGGGVRIGIAIREGRSGRR